jgi:hypothetical protein
MVLKVVLNNAIMETLQVVSIVYRAPLKHVWARSDKNRIVCQIFVEMEFVRKTSHVITVILQVVKIAK